MNEVYLVTRRFKRRGDSDELRTNIGCFASYKEAEGAILGIMQRINAGEIGGLLQYKNADWYSISGTSCIYVEADVYKDGNLYGNVSFHVEDMEIGTLICYQGRKEE